MSVLIKRMEMPKSCDKCELMTANYGCAFVGAVGGESYRKRAWGCPLVEVPEQMKWIPVTERLPETHDYVLCCGAKGGMFVGYISCFTQPQGFAWAWQHGGQGRIIKWWMPLPQPPKDGEP